MHDSINVDLLVCFNISEQYNEYNASSTSMQEGCVPAALPGPNPLTMQKIRKMSTTYCHRNMNHTQKKDLHMVRSAWPLN